VRLEVSCKDRLGITQDVLDVLVDYEIDLRGIEIDEAGKIFLNFPNILFEDFQDLMPKLRLLDGIEDVKTAPFMPSEREHYQLDTLLRTLPEPVLSVDSSSVVVLINDAALTKLNMSRDSVIGCELHKLIQQPNLNKWLDTRPKLAKNFKVQFCRQEYLLNVLPIYIPNSEGDDTFAGAVCQLKSELALEQQLTMLQEPDKLLPKETNNENSDLQPICYTQNQAVVESDESLSQRMKHHEKQILTSLFPLYPSSRLLAKKLRVSHTSIANKLKEYGISST
jgi:transcriptional regulator of aroF, aroG, tyrA and aromatic amino acid transport